MNESARRRYRKFIVASWLVMLAALGGIAYLLVAFVGGSGVVAALVFGYGALITTLAFWLAPKVLRRLGLIP